MHGGTSKDACVGLVCLACCFFPFGVVFTEWMELPQAPGNAVQHEQYILRSIAAIVASYYGFTNMGGKEKLIGQFLGPIASLAGLGLTQRLQSKQQKQS